MEFKTSREIDKWMEMHSQICKSYATAGEHYSFNFLPSGIIECQTVTCLICGAKKTSYVD